MARHSRSVDEALNRFDEVMGRIDRSSASREAQRRETRRQASIVLGKARNVGIALADCGPGWCESTLAVTPRHLQHGGIVHAGVQATMADHTAGAAATTILEAGQHVVTAEFKINYLRPARDADRLLAVATVVGSGRTQAVCRCDIFLERGGERKLCAAAQGTIRRTE